MTVCARMASAQIQRLGAKLIQSASGDTATRLMGNARMNFRALSKVGVPRAYVREHPVWNVWQTRIVRFRVCRIVSAKFASNPSSVGRILNV